jgi:hypothetical protein
VIVVITSIEDVCIVLLLRPAAVRCGVAEAVRVNSQPLIMLVFLLYERPCRATHTSRYL